MIKSSIETDNHTHIDETNSHTHIDKINDHTHIDETILAVEPDDKRPQLIASFPLQYDRSMDINTNKQGLPPHDRRVQSVDINTNEQGLSPHDRRVQSVDINTNRWGPSPYNNDLCCINNQLLPGVHSSG